MANVKKRTPPAKCQAKFARTMKKNGKWRGYKDYAGHYGAAKKYKTKNARRNLATDFLLIRIDGETRLLPRESVIDLKKLSRRFDIVKGFI